MKKFMIGACSLLLGVLLTGCQPTPDKPVVIQKNDGKLEEKLAQSPAAVQKYEAPTHWKETYKKDHLLTIEFDADITLPNADKYSVARVEPLAFTQQRVDELVHYFSGGKKLYKYPYVKTKADYAQEIVEAKRGQERDGQFVVTEDSKSWVKELEKKMSEAPDTYQREYTDTMLTYARDYESGKEDPGLGKNFLNVAFDTGSKDDPVLEVRNYEKGKVNFNGLWYYKPNRSTYLEHWYTEEINSYTSELGDAKKKAYAAAFAGLSDADKYKYLAEAEKALNDLQVKDLVLADAEKVALHDGTGRILPKGGYHFEFTRSNGGLAGYEQKSGMGRRKEEEPPAYTIPFRYEQVWADVSDEGILSFTWMGCAKVTGTESENVQLLPFEQIQEKVKNQIYYKKSFETRMFQRETTIKVTSVELRAGYINVKDHPDQALLVPMWVAHTEEMQKIPIDPARPEKGMRNVPGNKTDYLFNAIDGGVIEEEIPEPEGE